MRDGKESRKHEIGNAAPFAVGTRRGIKRRGDETLPFFFKEKTEPNRGLRKKRERRKKWEKTDAPWMG